MKKVLFVILFLAFLTTSSCAKRTQEEQPKTEDDKLTIELGSCPQRLVTDEELIKQLNSLNYDFNTEIEYNGKKYYKQTTNKYFEFAPILWDLTIINGEEIYVSRYIIHQQEFLNYNYVDVIGQSYSKKPGVPEKTNSNDYYYSDLREWLNGNFLSAAFSSEEISKLSKVTIDGLNDYVYTLSKDDVSALTYPCAKPTDYAKFVGCDVWTNVENDAQFIGNGTSWLRTPNNIHKYRVAAINYDGLVYEYVDCYYEGVGVRPAIKLK